MKPPHALTLAFAGFAALFVSHAHAIELSVEGGGLGFAYNDVQIPNDASGDRFDLLQLTGAGPSPYLRLSLQTTLADRHTVRAVYAPIRTEGTGTLGEDVRFAGEDFDGDTPIEGLYRFNTYRLTYRYTFLDTVDWRLGAGITGLVRDANIRLTQNGTRADDPDLGAVPLLHVNAVRTLGDRWSAEFDLDGLVSPQGRAVDAALMGRYQQTDRLRWHAGYRTLEGGGDNNSVYTFAWLHFGMAGLSYRF